MGEDPWADRDEDLEDVTDQIYQTQTKDDVVMKNTECQKTDMKQSTLSSTSRKTSRCKSDIKSTEPKIIKPTEASQLNS